MNRSVIFLMLFLLVFPLIPLNMEIKIPSAEGTTTDTFAMGNGGTLMGAGTPSGTDPCLVQSGTAGGWHSYSTGGSNFWFGKEDHDSCQIAMMVFGDITSSISAGATILSVKLDFPAFTQTYGSPPNFDIRMINYFDNETCQSTNDHDSDSAFYANVWNFSNPVLLNDVDASSAISNQLVTLNSNASAAIANQMVTTQMTGYVCLILWQTGVPHGGGSSNDMYKCCGGTGPVLEIEWELSTTFTLTVKMYDSTNSTQLTFRNPTITMAFINGTVSGDLDCSSVCTIGPVDKSTPVRILAKFGGHAVKIDGLNSYNRTCGSTCDIKIPVSVYDTTNLMFYDEAGAAVTATNFGITYSNSTSSTVTVGASSKSLKWLPNGTQSITSIANAGGLELNATTGFNVTANSQTFSFLLTNPMIELTLNLFADDMTTPLNFHAPTVRVLSLNGSASSYKACSNSCSFKLYENEPIGIQSKWNSLGVRTNTTNMFNMTVTDADTQSANLALSVFSMGFEFQSIDKTLDILPTSFVYALANGTEITQTNYGDSWFRNTTLTPKQINYHGTNMNTNGTQVSIESSGKRLFYLDYFEVSLRARNSDNSSYPVDAVSFKVRFINGTESTYSTDAGGITNFYMGNHTSIDVFAFWESLLVNSSQVAVSSASNLFFFPTSVYKDAADVVFFAVNNTVADNIRSFGIEIQFWSNHTSPQILKYKYNSERYNEPNNFKLNGTTYNSPALSWNWNDVTRILSLEIPFASGYNTSIMTPYDPSWGNSTIIIGLDPSTQMLFSGNLIGAALAPYTAIMGLWVYLLLAALPIMMTYIKSNSVGITLLTISFTSFAFISLGDMVLLPPIGVIVAYMILALSVAATFYRLLKRDD